jgi:threonine/homoserine/homoserine lactone efflux protein
MNTLIHDLSGFVWGIMLILGFVFGALVWIGMAIWDNARALIRRLTGEDRRQSGDDPYRL